jgi:deazaflavin-dependent oxidoreductase (nitroreductase family)
MTSLHRSPGLVLFWRFHRWLMRLTKGRIGGRLMGNKVLLLNATGRKSGQPRETALYTFPDGDNYIVIASNVGEEVHPGWYLNLRENPEASILIDGKERAVTAHEAEGDERERLWEMVTTEDENYAEYQTWTTRKIPVIVLEPRDRRDG